MRAAVYSPQSVSAEPFMNRDDKNKICCLRESANVDSEWAGNVKKSTELKPNAKVP